MNQNGSNDVSLPLEDDNVDDAEERELLQQLETNKGQLEFINTQLEADPENGEFQLLKSSLEELVGLLEGELLQLKKQKLLGQLNSQYTENDTTKELDTKNSNDDEDIDDNDQNQDQSLESLIEQLDGQECSVPFLQAGGTTEVYCDAILKAEYSEESSNFKFRAFFLYPLTEAMLTCPFYLRDSCKFCDTTSSSPCKYSHGRLVSVEQIRPKISYTLGEESSGQHHSKLCCLVRNTALPAESRSQAKLDASLWSRGVVIRTDEAMGRVLVRLAKDSKDYWILAEQLVMMDEDFEEEDLMQEDGEELEHSDSAAPPLHIPTLNPSPSSFGDWERYTTGIGSKLLAKMGYQAGTGLGSNSQGILNPIETFIYPTGKSLDTCFQLKAESVAKKTDVKEILREKKREAKEEVKRVKQYEKADRQLKAQQQRHSVAFQFLNDMFYTSGSDRSPLERTKEPGSSFSSATKPQSKQIKSLDHKSLTVTSFQNDEELRKAEQELKKIEDSYKRNVHSGTDQLVVKTLTEKRNKHRANVERLRKRSAEFGREKKQRQDKEKFRFF